MQPKTLSLKLGSAPTIEPARSAAAIVQPPPLPHWAAFPDSFPHPLSNGVASMSAEEILAELVEMAARERVSDLQSWKRMLWRGCTLTASAEALLPKKSYHTRQGRFERTGLSIGRLLGLRGGRTQRCVTRFAVIISRNSRR
jgi:hypothetical protein